MRSESASQVLIYDPVAGFIYTLNPQRKTYSRTRIQDASATVSIAASGNWTSVNQSSGTSAMPGSLAWMLPPLLSGRMRMTLPANEELAPQMVNGILAKGSRITSTIPAGAFGNDRDVKIVNERWYSDDLQVLVKSSNSDPRFGTTTYELTGILQAAPDPALFHPPADYSMGQIPRQM
jgi:hypothetical protein